MTFGCPSLLISHFPVLQSDADWSTLAVSVAHLRSTYPI